MSLVFGVQPRVKPELNPYIVKEVRGRERAWARGVLKRRADSQSTGTTRNDGSVAARRALHAHQRSHPVLLFSRSQVRAFIIGTKSE